MEDNRTLYEKSVQDRSTLRYYLGLIARWKQNWKYVRARRIARKRGATIGEGVIMPISLAKRLNKNVTIGDHTIIQTSDFTTIRYPITIGSHVIIGTNVRISIGSHNIDSPEWEFCRHSAPLVIEDYTWLCPNSTILPSCSRVGYGAVVGANAVVAKDIEPMSVVVGFPAKHVRYRKCVHSAIVVESLIGGDYQIYKETRKRKK